jgi:DNA-binding PadR family transcriptional regulator
MVTSEDNLPQNNTGLTHSAFLILLAVADRPRHGLGIVDEIARETDDAVRLGPGTLYGTIQKLVASGLLRETSEAPDPDDHDTRRRYFLLTARGRATLRAEARQLQLIMASATRKRVLVGA